MNFMAWKRRETFYFVINSYLKDSTFTAIKMVYKGLSTPGFSCCTGLRGIDLFSLYVLYSRTQRSQGNLTLCLFVRTYAREQDEIWKKQFSRVLSHDLYWENKTYKLKRSVREVKHHVTYNVKRKFVPRDQASPLQYTCRLLFIISTHK